MSSTGAGKRTSLGPILAPPPKRFCPPEGGHLDARRAEALRMLSDLDNYPDLFAVDELQDDQTFSVPNPPSSKENFEFKAPKPRKTTSTSTPLGLPFVTYNVSADRTKFLEFVSRWRQVRRYAFSLVYINRAQGKPNSKPKKKQTRTKTGFLYGSDNFIPASGTDATLAQEDTLFLADAQKPIALVVTWEKARCYVIPFSARDSGSNKASKSELKEERIRLIKSVLESGDAERIVFDGKPQLKLLLAMGISVTSGLRDPRIAAWILEPDIHKDASLRELVEKYTDSSTVQSLEMKPNSNSASSTMEPAIHAALLQSHQALLAMSALDEELKLNSQYELFTNVEMKLLPILAKMEFYGVGFSTESLLKARNMVESKIRNLESRAYKVARREFDLNSPMEVSYILFEHLKLAYPSLDVSSKVGFAASVLNPEPSNSKTSAKKSGSNGTTSRNDIAAAPMRTKRVEKSTKAEILQAMMTGPNPNPLPEIILEHRMLSHTVNNYMDPLPHFAFHSKHLNMRRIYSTCHQTCIPTGRLAFDHPNLQSIRHAFEFVPVSSQHSSSSSTSLSDSQDSPPGDKKNTSSSSSKSGSPITPTGAPIEVNIRDSFIASPEHTLVSFDYCQLELRIMAHFANDTRLLEQLRDPTVDMFNVVAGQWLLKSPLDVQPEERAQAKHICYAVLYGQGTNALARMLKVSKADAKRFREDFNKRFAGLVEFTKSVVRSTTECGYTETLGGRRRHFPQIYSRREDRGDREDYARAVRQITNTVCQGSAADIVKIATIRIEEMLAKIAPTGRCIINLHDELVYELPTLLLPQLIPSIQNIMESVMQLKLPLPVRIFFGQTWGHLAPWTEPAPDNGPT